MLHPRTSWKRGRRLSHIPELAELLQPIRAQLDAVDALLLSTLDSAADPIRSALGDLLRGGKRLRPALVLFVAGLYGCDAVPFQHLGAGLELLHTATLIHDDVIDQATLRRGRRTLHLTWSGTTAVLGGDYLLAEAVAMTSALGSPRLVQILAQTLRAMCAGEIGQSLRHRQPEDLRQAYFQTVQTKSASLFAAAAEMAGTLAGAAEEHVVALRSYGWELGIAFQMTDDILDITGSPAVIGKDLEADLRHGLITLPTLIYLETSHDSIAVSSVLNGQRDQPHLAAAIEAILTSGAIEAATEETRNHADQARQSLSQLPDNTWRQRLDDLVTFSIERRA